MKIGICFDLKKEYLEMGFTEEQCAEFERDGTIDAIDGALQELGHSTERIGHIRSLVKALADGKSWGLVFNITEGIYGSWSRESQVPALLDAYNIPYTFSDPLVLGVSLKKDLAKLLVQSAGIATPDYAVVQSMHDLIDVELPFPVFAKPLAEGTSKGITARSRVDSRDELAAVVEELLERFEQPVLLETFCSGREFTTGITGTGPDAVYEGALEIVLLDNAEKNAYSYQNKENCEELVEYRLVSDPAINKELEDLSLAIWRLLGCRDAGRIDFMQDASGVMHFIEANPLAGLHPEHSDICILFNMQHRPYTELMQRIINSASKRTRE